MRVFSVTSAAFTLLSFTCLQPSSAWWSNQQVVDMGYRWRNGEWSACSCDGKQSRAVMCTNKGSVTAEGAKDDSLWCLPSMNPFCGSKPSTQQSCQPPAQCNQYRWRVGEWNPCSASCGSGSQSRPVLCTDQPLWNSPGAYHDPLYCMPSTNPFCGSQPPAQQQCHTPCSTYSWFRQEGQCSVTCGSGTKPVSVVCQDNNGNTVDDSKCAGQQKPSTTPVSCTTGVQCQTYSWFRQEGQCSVSCGSGTKPVKVVCQSSSGQSVDDSKCSGQKPDSSPVPCQAASQCEIFTWVRHEGECSASCGQGTKSVTVVCQSSSGQSVDDSKCSGQQKPTSTPVPCQAAEQCETYSWFTQQGQCSVTCGVGTKPVRVICKSSSGQQVDDSKCAGQNKPDSTPVPCSTNVQCQTYSWLRQEGQCSVTCGQGTKQVTVVCKSSSGQTVDDSQCAAQLKPDSTPVSCSTGVQCESCQWFRQEGQCSASCGQGTKSVTVVCQSPSGQTVDNSKCSGQNKPSSTPVPCNAAMQCETYQWFRQEGQCSVTCGSGTKTVTVVCKSSSGQSVDDIKCSGQQKPDSTPVPCSTGMSCQMPGTGSNVVPSSSSTASAPSTPTYHYQIGQWSQCSVTCGLGTQTRDVICVCVETGRRVNDNHCSGSKPPTSKLCNTQVQCQHKTFSWWTGNWSSCSATCGQHAVRTRQVYCKDEAGNVVDESKCSGQQKPSTQDVCAHLPDCGGNVVGDPVFSPLLGGEKYQVHGVDGAIYNIITDQHTLVNARFKFLSEGRCPVIDGVERRGNNGICWTHPGSYLGEIGMKNDRGDEIYLLPGAYDQGFLNVTVNGESMKVGQERGDDAHIVQFINTHTVRVQTPSFTLLFESSDEFVNLITKVKNWQSVNAHGLLGQSSSGKIYNENLIKQVEGRVDEYMVPTMFSNEFKYDIYGKYQQVTSEA